MVVYEVNLEVDPTIAVEFEAWLGPHAEEVSRCPGFTGFKQFRVEGTDDKVRWCMHYFVESREALASYFERDAPRLREDGLRRFPNQFTATRRILLETNQTLNHGGK